jgi:catechol 2,3-dioxygenase-like lactoylglutathione lyase family enzyme
MLRDARFETTLPVVNVERARKFYEETLGLRVVESSITGGPEFVSGEGTRFALYERETPTTADHTVGGWIVEDVEQVVDTLSEKGVVFEQYDMPGLKTDARGIATMGPWKGAFFKDPEGNILGIAQFN